MNPDPFAPVDLDTPFRFDHVLHFLTSVALCVAVIVGLTGAALVIGGFTHRKRTRNGSQPRMAPALANLGTPFMAKIVQTLRFVRLRAGHPS